MKIRKLMPIFLASVFGLTLLAGCVPGTQTSSDAGTSEPTSTSQEVITTLTLDKTTVSLDLFENATLLAETNSQNTVSWESSNENVATVDQTGKVFSVGEGSATITATVDGVSATCSVSVDANGKEASLSLDVTDLSITPDQEYELTPVLTYNSKNLSATFEYTSSDTDVVTVTSGTVKGIAVGEATVTVEAKYYSVEKSLTLPVTVVADLTISLNETEIVLGAIDTDEYDVSATLTALVVAQGEEVNEPVISWSSDNTSVATVTNGVVTAVGVGQTKVHATYTDDDDTVSAEATIKVVRPVLDGALTNNLIDFESADGEKAKLDLTGLSQVAADVISITIQRGEDSVDVPFEVVAGELYVQKSALVAGGNALLISFTKVSYKVNVRVICDEALLLEFANANDVARTSIYWSDAHTATLDTETKLEGEPGSIKITYNKVQEFNYLLLNNLLFSDVADFDYIEFSVYNSTEHEFTIQPTWVDGAKIAANGWTEVKFFVADIVNGSITNMSGTTLTAGDINGYAICFYGPGFEAGDSINFSSFRATKEERTEVNFYSMVNAPEGLNPFAGRVTVEYSTAKKYAEEDGSLKVVNTSGNSDCYVAITAPEIKDITTYDHLSFRVYNDTDHEMKIGVLWAKDTIVAAGEWGEVTITSAEFDTLNIQNLAGDNILASNATGLALRLFGGFAQDDVCYISNVVLYKNPAPVELTDVVLHANDVEGCTEGLSIISESVDLAFDSTVKFGEENGSLKVTHKAGGESYILVDNPTVTDITDYDRLTFRVHNDSDHDIQAGTTWAKDTTVKAGKWAEVTITVAEFETINVTQYWSGNKMSKTNISGFVIRLMGGWANGDVCHISNIMLYSHPLPVSEDVVLHANDVEGCTEGLSIISESVDLAFDSTVKFGEENGSLKVTHKAGGESYILVDNPAVKDITDYDRLTFRVHNDSDHDIQAGTTWAKDTTVKAGEWAEVTITVAEFDTINVTQYWSGNKMPKTDISGFVIRLMGGWANGDVCHISNIILYA